MSLRLNCRCAAASSENAENAAVFSVFSASGVVFPLFFLSHKQICWTEMEAFINELYNRR